MCSAAGAARSAAAGHVEQRRSLSFLVRAAARLGDHDRASRVCPPACRPAWLARRARCHVSPCNAGVSAVGHSWAATPTICRQSPGRAALCVAADRWAHSACDQGEIRPLTTRQMRAFTGQGGDAYLCSRVDRSFGPNPGLPGRRQLGHLLLPAHLPAVRRVRLGVKALSKVGADTADLCICYGPATNAGSCCARDHAPRAGGDERPVAWRGGGHPRMADLTA